MHSSLPNALKCIVIEIRIAAYNIYCYAWLDLANLWQGNWVFICSLSYRSMHDISNNQTVLKVVPKFYEIAIIRWNAKFSINIWKRLLYD